MHHERIRPRPAFGPRRAVGRALMCGGAERRRPRQRQHIEIELPRLILALVLGRGRRRCSGDNDGRRGEKRDEGGTESTTGDDATDHDNPLYTGLSTTLIVHSRTNISRTKWE